MTTVDRFAQARENAKRFRPTIGRSVPPSIIRLVLAVGLVVLSFTIIGLQWWLAFALFLVLATFIFPRSPAVWALAVLLGVLSLGPFGTVPTWKFYVALAAAQLLHIAGMTLNWLPVGGAIELRVIGRILRPLVLVQVPVQVAAFVVLTLLHGKAVTETLTSPVFALVAGAGFVLLIAVLLVPILRSRAGD